VLISSQERFSHRALLPGAADEPNEKIEAIGLAVVGFAVGEARKPAESTPSGGARIGVGRIFLPQKMDK